VVGWMVAECKEVAVPWRLVLGLALCVLAFMVGLSVPKLSWGYDRHWYYSALVEISELAERDRGDLIVKAVSEYRTYFHDEGTLTFKASSRLAQELEKSLNAEPRGKGQAPAGGPAVTPGGGHAPEAP